MNINNIKPKQLIQLRALPLLNFIVYYASQLITGNMAHGSLYSQIDEMIPFCSVFIIPYVLAYFQWIAGYIIIVMEQKSGYERYIYGEMIAKAMAGIAFILIPTTIARPYIAGENVFSSLVGLIYALDNPTNLFPSIHCLESYMVARGIMNCDSVSAKMKTANAVLTVLVCASTVMIKQHVFADIIGGILFAEAGIRIYDFIIRKVRAKHTASVVFYGAENKHRGKAR